MNFKRSIKYYFKALFIKLKHFECFEIIKVDIDK